MSIDSEQDVFERFRISEKFGFLLENPDRELPEPYHIWQDVAERIPKLIGSHELDDEICSMPVLHVDELRTHRQHRLAHVVLSTLSSAYIWNNANEPKLTLCKSIAVPFYEISQVLDIPTIPTHASGCLANWKKINPHEEWSAENLDIVSFRFREGRGNAWFFVNTAQIEKNLAPAIAAVADLVVRMEKDEIILKDEYQDCFRTIREGLLAAGVVIGNFKKHLAPEEFYHGFRQFMAGYTEGPFKDQGGLILEGLEHLGPQPISGASAAQSSTIQTFDAFLKIVHIGNSNNFLLKQRNFMPVPHRKFIEWVEKNSSEDVKDIPGYDEVVAALRGFRSLHIRLVTSYIFTVKKEGTANLGTGGTSFMHFLKDVRDDCR